MLLILTHVVVRRAKGRDVALHCRKELRKLCHSWCDRINASFSSITDQKTETKHFIYFYLGHAAILLFKTQ